MSQTVAIIGYGTAAVNAAIALRTAGFQGKIQAFSNTCEPPYSPMMTAAYAAGACDREGMFPWGACDLELLDVQVENDAPVTHLDVGTRTIVAGESEYSYDLCLVASGARPVGFTQDELCDFPQDVRPLTLRSLADAEALRDVLTDKKAGRILVSGTSMVALKAVDACLERNMPVTLLGRGEHLMRKTACAEIAAAFENALIEKGVDLRLSQVIEKVGKKDDGWLRVAFSNGDVADYGCILLARGISPNLDFLPEDVFSQVDDGCIYALRSGAESGGAAGTSGDIGERAACADAFDARVQGLPVDAFMRTSVPTVYAAGDVARVLDASTGKRTIAGLWKEACLQGACAGRAMAAVLAQEQPREKDRYDGFIPSNCITVAGCVILSAGTMELTEKSWSDIQQHNGCMIATVYEQSEADAEQAVERSARQTSSDAFCSEEALRSQWTCDAKKARLIGYNVFSNNADPSTSLAYDEAAMLYKQLQSRVERTFFSTGREHAALDNRAKA